MPSLFTRIINGEIPSHRVYGDELPSAFLHISPRSGGHTLVVPKRQVDYLFDLPEEDYAALWATCAVVATALKAATGCRRGVVLAVGYEIPPAHVHPIPTDALGDVPFPPVDAAAAGHLAETADRARPAIG